MTPVAGTRVIGYTRVSTEEQGQNGVGLQAQEEAIRAKADAAGWQLLDVVDDKASGKSMRKRPGLERCLAVLDAGFAEALIVAKLDRLSRSLVDFGHMLEQARAKGWKIVVLDMDLDMTTAAGEMTANTLMNFAQFERRLIGERTKSALAVKKAQGVKLGRPANIPGKVIARIVREHDAGASLGDIARGLTADEVPTSQGGQRWYASTVRAVLERVKADQAEGEALPPR